MRFVLDTATIVAALRSNEGASRQLLVWALERRYTSLASVALFVEYEAVATRPEHLRSAGWELDEVGAVLDALAGVVEPVSVSYSWRPMARDADDDMVLEAAVNGRADAIVTFNVRDVAAAAERFGVDVLTPGRAVQLLRASA